MRVELHDHLGHPLVAQATRVVIYDDFGNPVSLAVQISPVHIKQARLLDPDFTDLLSELGITRTVVVNRLTKKDLKIPKAI